MAKKRKGGGSFAHMEINGLDEYLAKLEKAQVNLQEGAVRGVDAAINVVFKDMREILDRHRDTGTTVNALEKRPAEYSKAKQTASGEVGIFAESRDSDNFIAFMRARYQEFGTNTVKADSWLRNTMDTNGPEIRKEMKKILEEMGVDT